MSVFSLARRALCISLLFLTACGTPGRNEDSSSKDQTAKPSGPAIQLERIDPEYTVVGQTFNKQPDGEAALAVVGPNIPAGAVAYWNDQALKTGGGGRLGWLGVAVPEPLYSSAGVATITVRSADGALVSNALTFTVFPKTGPAPEIADLYPTDARAGKGFNVQPGGESALAVNGNAFLPGARVFFAGKEVKTVFVRATSLTGIVMADVASKLMAGKVEVWVVNPDGKSSPKVTMTIK